MASYVVQTRLPPEEVLTRAERFFGAEGLSLKRTERTQRTGTWQGGGGMVSVSVTPGKRSASVEIATREWDAQAQRFLRRLRIPWWRWLVRR